MTKYTPQPAQLELTFDEIPYGYCHCGCGQKTPLAKGNNRKRGIVKGQPLLFIHPHQNRVNCKRGPVEQRFWSKVAIAGQDECWLWMGTVLHTGYGQFWDGAKLVMAHRFAYALAHGSMPDDLLGCHRCDVRRCCNPAHIFAGTQVENLADMYEKGRNNPATGELHGLARFTNEQAKALREQFAQLNISVLQFAKMHNVPDETMRRLINRVTYKNV